MEHFQEGTLEARKSTYLESLSETFSKGIDGKPVCYLIWVSSACRQRMSYISLSSKKASDSFIGYLIIRHPREARILFSDLCSSHAPINRTVKKHPGLGGRKNPAEAGIHS